MPITYDTGPNSDTNTQRELVLHRYCDGRNMLCGISDDRKKNQPDPFLPQSTAFGNSIDTIDKKLSGDCDEL